MTTETAARFLSESLRISFSGVHAVLSLLEEGATIPFIARYRKEKTGGLDEVQVLLIRDNWEKKLDLERRRSAILVSIQEQGQLTVELRTAIEAAQTMSVLEDLYLPFKPKRKTRASIAVERGLEPFADAILTGSCRSPEKTALDFVNPNLGVTDYREAIQGAMDIIAEKASENPSAREELRQAFMRESLLACRAARGKKDLPEASRYRDYFEFAESVKTIPSHRILAIFRGESEKFLSARLEYPADKAITILESRFVSPIARQGATKACLEIVTQALADALERLLAPALETEIRSALKERADEQAIQVFAANVREVLMAPPLGSVATLAVDPGLRTGCKLAVLGDNGDPQAYETIFPLEPFKKIEESARAVKDLVEKYRIKAIAIGNGTGGREAMAFFTELRLKDVILSQVNESGASIYSASPIAREEFPDLDLTVRGAISIGRRLMDPLSELVKLDPKSIGVGQYQHDVDQKALKRVLDETVASCVNAVGVDLNTASTALLRYVSGLNEKTALSIVAFRRTSGGFRSRQELKKVPGLGPKTFELAAGFLRIRNGENALDGSGVHPESYPLVEKIAFEAGLTLAGIVGNKDIVRTFETRAKDFKALVIGERFEDILGELARPGRDPRKNFETFAFAENIRDISDISEGMQLPGIVTNVTAFGAFIDIGLHEQGLAHISQLSDSFVRDPNTVVKAGQKVLATVLGVDLERRRISLSLKTAHHDVHQKERS